MRCPCPNLLQRTATESASPEAAEIVEADAEQDAKHKTHGVTAYSIETEPPVVEDETSDDALEKVVGQAHLAYALKVRDGFLHASLVIKERDATHIEGHHGKIAPCSDLNLKALADTR